MSVNELFDMLASGEREKLCAMSADEARAYVSENGVELTNEALDVITGGSNPFDDLYDEWKKRH